MSHDHVPADYARLNGWDRPYDVYVRPDAPQYSGAIVSFCKLPLVESREALAARKPDVVIAGAPLDDGVSYRPGARFGPRAIRQASYNFGGHSLQLGVQPFEVLDVVDAGDANVVPGMLEHGHDMIFRTVPKIAAKDAVPIIL
ncbi:MAG: arginase family protein, partial [Candidatus Limnocylindrales bacterium]